MTVPTQNGHRENEPTLKIAALFAGIGGIELGFHQVDSSPFKTDLFCEVDDAALNVLKHHFPDADFIKDVVDIEGLPCVDILTGGFPCQDLSQAGKAKGMNGSKSSVVTHVFRLLEKQQVPWVILENVPFMLQLDKGRAMDYLVEQFERLGYQWAYRVIDSRALGIPQRRKRVFFVASLNEDPRKVVFKGNMKAPTRPEDTAGLACGFYWTEGTRGLGWAVNSIPTLKGGSGLGIPSPPAIWLPNGDFIKPHICDAERLQGFEADWTLPAEEVDRPTSRWRLVGNAVAVPVAKWLGERLMALDGDTDTIGSPVEDGVSWPSAAWNVGDGRFKADYSHWPCVQELPDLASFLKYESQLLSERATAGFLSRFKASSLSRPSGFVAALEEHLERMALGEAELLA